MTQGLALAYPSRFTGTFVMLHRLTQFARLFAVPLRRSSDESGNIAILFGLSLPLIMGSAGLAVETGYWYYRSLNLQSASDAAAYAAALEKLGGSDSTKMKAAAVDVATGNQFEAATGTISVYSPPSTGPNAGKKGVEVILNQTLPRFFSQVFDETPLVISRRSVAVYAVDSNACMLALDPTASRTVLMSGSASVNLTGCSAMANSTATDAIRTQGSATMTVDCLISAGGVDLTSGSVTTRCAKPVTNAAPAYDPFADLVAPSTSGSCNPTNGGTLQPGVYCSGLTLNGTVKLKPGVYVISGGDFRINSNANISGSDVTIYLAGNARVTMNGTATVQLSAPTTGAYSGVLFFGDRASAGGTNKFNGTANSLLTGALYFAKQKVEYLGNFSGNGGCTQLVAKSIEWTGNANIKQDCSNLGIRDIPATQIVKLVE